MRPDIVVPLEALDRTQLARAGGKAANLGELTRIAGVRVPAGFVVTTAAPDDVGSEIAAQLARLGPDAAYAVRSSATAEDLPTASFAGQHDSFLGVVGLDAIVERVRACRASLATDRAIAYRRRAGIDDGQVRMAVVVQRMIEARVSGVLFTADPMTGNRRVAVIEATAGLGDALVSGQVNAESITVRDGAVVTRPARPLLTDAQAIGLVELGRRIEAHFGAPQDVEWCLADDGFAIVQSRPITTLFPIPTAPDDAPRVYLSVGHQQMMTDAIKPLGVSVWQLTAARPMATAGSRLFVDVTRQLAVPAMRAGLFAMAGKSDPLVKDALETLLARGFIATIADPPAIAPPPAPSPIDNDPAIVAGLIAASEARIATLVCEIRTTFGPALFDFIRADLAALKQSMFDPRAHQALFAGIEATWWLDDKLRDWLGETGAADVLAQSAANNVTSQMGLALLDVADVLRPYADRLAGDDFLDRLPADARAAVTGYLDRYGVRCVGEIDVTRPRWREQPRALVPLLLANIKNWAPGEAARRFEHGLAAAAHKEAELLARVRALPDGEAKAADVKWQIDRLRTFIGYREYPKFEMISHYSAYRDALRGEAARLVEAGVLRDPEDVYFFTFDELEQVVRTQRADAALLRARKDAFRAHQALTPPRVLTSEGEGLDGSYRRDDLPAGALAGLAVSAGTVEGRARVVHDIGDADLEPGDILVTAFTDPSWTPAFVAIAGLVTEVGGLMTHGAVIAREYGLPAVVGVAHATTRIRDGQRIRVHGTAGYVELLGEPG